MIDKVGVGIIGTGFGRRVQAPAFLACDDARIVSIASGNIANAEAAADEFGIGHYTADWRETVSHPDVHLVCITTPPSMHHEMTLFAVEQGKAIMCEKPMAMNLAESKEMTAAAAAKPLLAVIDHELRFQPGRQLAYRMLRDGVIGRVRHAKAIFQAPHRGDPSVPWNWWSDRSMGGGALGAIASHVIDSLHWFLDCEIRSVYCQLQTHIKQRKDSSGEMREVTSDDESNMLVRFTDGELTSGATGLISVSMVEHPKYANIVEFYGTKGSMRVGAFGEISLAVSTDDDWQPIEVDIGKLIPNVPDTGFSRAFMAFAPEVIRAVSRGECSIEHAATFDDGVRVQRVLDAARESNSNGTAISV